VNEEGRRVRIRYYSCCKPNCYNKLKKEVDDKDQREGLILYCLLMSIIIGVSVLLVLFMPEDIEQQGGAR